MAPTDLLWRLVDSATGRQIRHEPVISEFTAALISVLFTSLYVLPFYFSPRTRPSPTLNRDAPSVIQARIKAVTITVTGCILATFYLLHKNGHLDVLTTLHQLGVWPISPLAILKPLLLTFLLFLGPLYHDIFLQGSLSPISNIGSELITSLSSSIGYRNYVAGPVTEEFLFRSALLPIHLLSPLHNSPKQLVFIAPLYFGVAHVHHFYEFRLNHPDTPLTPALLRTIFQFGYTTVFGWYAAFVYLRTGNLYTVILIHAFCNYMGLPKLWGKVRPRANQSRFYSPAQSRPNARGKDDVTRGSTVTAVTDTPSRLTFASGLDSHTRQTILYYALLLIGVYTFGRSLFVLTDFRNLELVSFGRDK